MKLPVKFKYENRVFLFFGFFFNWMFHHSKSHGQTPVAWVGEAYPVVLGERASKTRQSEPKSGKSGSHSNFTIR